MTQQLSPIAQAVQFAAFRVYDEEELLYVVPAEKHAGMVAAAALRAAADQLGDEMIVVGEGFKGLTRDDWRIVHVEDLLAIATELEVK